jgi:hypothetical protein
MPRTINQLAQVAIDVQDACNLTGVIYSFSECMSDLRLLARAEGWEGTDKLNRHPIAVLFSSKIASLTYSESCVEFGKAYDWAKDQTANKSTLTAVNE